MRFVKGSLAKGKLPRTVFELGWVSLFTDVATEMSYPLLPAFLETMGAAGVWLGLVEGVAESVGAFVKFFAGSMSDRRGGRRKPFVLFGYTLSTLVRPLLALATAPWQVVALRASDRVGKGVRSAPRDALLAAAVTPEVRGYAFGFHQMMDNLGAVLGPLLAFVLATYAHLSLRPIFALAIVPGLVAVATLALGVREPAAEAAGPAPASATKLDRRTRSYLAAVLVFGLGSSADTFLMLRLERLHLATGLVPLAWLSLNAMKALTNLPGGRLSDRFGHRPALLAGWLLYAASYAAFAFVSSLAGTWVVMLAYGAYYGLTEGAQKALLTELTSADQRGRAFGALHAITGAAVLPANAVFGALFDAHPAAAFLLGSAFAGVGALLLLLVR